MNARLNDLIEDLRREAAAVQHLIEEVIHLDGIKQVKLNSEEGLRKAKLEQQSYYQQSKLPLTQENLAFLDSTWQGQQHVKKIAAIRQNIESNINHDARLQHEREFRMRPLNDLLTHVSDHQSTINTNYIGALLNTARVINPEGSIRDRLKMIGSIIKSIVTLRFYEISDTWQTQSKRNKVRSSINGLFKSREIRNVALDEALPPPRLLRV